MQELIDVVVVEPGQKPYKKTIKNDLTKLQQEVDGYIEVLCPFKDRVAIVCNEEGKIVSMTPNRALFDDNGRVYDVISGTFLIVGLGEENFISLTEKQIESFIEIYKRPQVFVKTSDGIRVIHLED